ncbi:sulfite exporter TauE/SafE family protein [Herbaspirillum autotrophicum]|uniref:sulfite exporter TauE/SafE family protein n=1 Tax=Herbaspirillum autotrophicum TaxID=180195 RepID=UPI00067B7254|nr:sulfite exporter TauE/SafE family protein [Herbaspirillum autotrophicum]
MDWTIIALLFFSGVAGGIINALAGGATLITFPVMLAAGLAPVTANASNAVAIAPGHLIAAFADREKFPRLDRHLMLSLALCVAGGVMGALLLLALPDHLFVLPVPALVAFATLLFACAPRISAWAGRRRRGAEISRTGGLATLTCAAVYGGFFGAALGIILTAVLALAEPDDIRKVKVLKNMLATAVSLAAITIFIIQDAVKWQETSIMLAGALPGGYAGGMLVRVLPAHIVRWCVIAAGMVMSLIYAQRYWC